MSSYICGPEQFRAVENRLHLIAAGNNTDLHLYPIKDCVPKWYDKRHYSIEAIEKEISSHIETLAELQAVCVSLQYKHHYEGDLDTEIKTQVKEIKRKVNFETIDLMQCYKYLQCITYQIEINHLQELRELTEDEEKAIKFAEGIIRAIADFIIDNSS